MMLPLIPPLYSPLLRRVVNCGIYSFHGADTDTDILAGLSVTRCNQSPSCRIFHSTNYPQSKLYGPFGEHGLNNVDDCGEIYSYIPVNANEDDTR